MPATTGTCGSSARTARSASNIRCWWPCAVSIDQDVDAGVEQLCGLARHVAVDADRGGDPQPAVRVDGRAVERRAQRAGAGEDADEPPVVVDDRGEPAPGRVELVERRCGVDRRRAGSAGRAS